MKCPTIIDLELSQSSLDAIKQIAELSDLEKLGRSALLIGQLWSIFGGATNKGASGSGLQQYENSLAFKIGSSDSAQSGYAIYSSNWDMFFNANNALSAIKLRQIEKLAYQQANLHVTRPKEYQFWRAVYLGCSYD